MARLTPKNQEKYDQSKAAAQVPHDDFGRADALDYLESGINIVSTSDMR